MSDELRYKYHVVYLSKERHNHGLGNMTSSIDLSRRYKFRSTEDVKSTVSFLEEEYGLDEVVILSWTAYEKESWFSKLKGIFK